MIVIVTLSCFRVCVGLVIQDGVMVATPTFPAKKMEVARVRLQPRSRSPSPTRPLGVSVNMGLPGGQTTQWGSGGVPQVDSIGAGARGLRRPMSAMDHTRSSGTPITPTLTYIMSIHINHTTQPPNLYQPPN